MKEVEPAVETKSKPEDHSWSNKNNKQIEIFVVVVAMVAVFFVGFVIGRVSTPNGPIALRQIHISKQMGNLPAAVTPWGPLASPSTSHSTLQGVVTNVNGSAVTVVGDGVSNIIQTNSSTQYEGGSSVADNDSVLVYGSLNNNTFTASQIDIN